MSDLELQTRETWNIHNRTCLFLIENLPEEAFGATLSKRGGRDIARQLAHMHMVRVNRLTAFSKKSAMPLRSFDKAVSPSKADLFEAFKQSGAIMSEYIQSCLENGGAVPNFKRGLIPMLGYFISHEAHHRGHILLTMKQNGIKLPDNLKWGIWEWNKI